MLNGVKIGVPHAARADRLAVVAEADDGLAVFLVAPDAPGVTVTPQEGLDPSGAPCRVTLEDVAVARGRAGPA